MTEVKSKGFIVFYINYFPELNQNSDDIVKAIRAANQEALDKIKAEGLYDIMFVPTTKEATRVEKIDYEKPFPRRPQIVGKAPMVSLRKRMEGNSNG